MFNKHAIQFECFSVEKESIVDVKGTVKRAYVEVASCSQSDVELHVNQFWVVSRAEPRLPLLIEDASRPVDDSEV